MSYKYKSDFIQLIPIIISQVFGVFCTFIFLTSKQKIGNVTPFPETGTGSLGNAFYFVIIVGLGASFLYILLKRKKIKLIKLVTGFALTIAIFFLSFIYLLVFFSNFNIPYKMILILILSTFITVGSDVIIFLTKNKVHNLLIILLGGALGSFLGYTVPTFSALLILVFLAIYDIFAVYYGPVGKIAKNGIEELRGLSFSFKDLQMGLGDLTFYAMLSGHMLLNFGYFSSLAAILGVLLGSVLSFKMLKWKNIFPGLPLPVFLGLLLSFIVLRF